MAYDTIDYLGSLEVKRCILLQEEDSGEVYANTELR